MDSFDRELLRLVQRDNRQTNEALAQAVNLSPSAVRRRLRKLREDGPIVADIALLDSNALGFTVITGLRCAEESVGAYREIERLMKAAEEVLQCSNVSGSVDFIVIAQMRDMTHYNEWVGRYVLDCPLIERCDTHFVYRRSKFETALPV